MRAAEIWTWGLIAFFAYFLVGLLAGGVIGVISDKRRWDYGDDEWSAIVLFWPLVGVIAFLAVPTKGLLKLVGRMFGD